MTLNDMYPAITPRNLSTGDVIRTGKVSYLLAQVGPHTVCAIGLMPGHSCNRYTDPVEVAYTTSITREELLDIIDHEDLDDWVFSGTIDMLVRP